MIDFTKKIEEALHEQNDETSHRELDAHTFHPSQMAMCERQMYRSKLGIAKHDTKLLGIFRVGTLIHEWIENNVANDLPLVEFEKHLEKTYHNEQFPVTITGHCDVLDRYNGIVYDFKTRSSWYKFDPPTQRHVDQLLIYMDMADVDKAQVVYICKKDMEVKTYPENDTMEFDTGRWNEIMKKAERVSLAIQENHFPKKEEEIPFGKCGCFPCNSEGENQFGHLHD